jgi:hypothetical protein
VQFQNEAGDVLHTIEKQMVVHALAEALALDSQVALANEAKPKDALNTSDVAVVLDTTVRGVYALYERGKLPRSIGPGRRLLWDRALLIDWLRKRALMPGSRR